MSSIGLRMTRFLGGFVFASALGCGGAVTELPPTGQVLLFIDTDAPVPEPPRTASSVIDPMRPPALFDRLRIDVYPCAAVDLCPPQTRDLEIDSSAFTDGTLSFGVLPSSAKKSSLVRARLYRKSVTSDEPVPDVTIDVIVMLPTPAPEGVLERTLFLPTSRVGLVSDLAAPTQPLIGRPSPSRVGTWGPAKRIDCAEPPGPGEVCIPGGAFWKGSDLLRDNPGFLNDDPLAAARRLVVLSPYYLDDREVTVAALRARGLAGDVWSGNTTLADPIKIGADLCDYTTEPGSHEDLPVNCVSYRAMDLYCAELGKELPTESQFEFASGGSASALYPWGDDPPTCADANLAHDWSTSPDQLTSHACRPEWKPTSFTVAVDQPLPAGSGKRDFFDPPGRHHGRVLDLVGNLSELVADQFQYLNEGCWNDVAIRTDPRCDVVTTMGQPASVSKGGTWVNSQGSSIAAFRYGLIASEVKSPFVGFRCARPAAPAP